MTIAFIPLRGGSKSIPLKNIKLIANKPLASWTIEAAAACEEIERVYVSTDDDAIRDMAENLQNPKVEVVGRSTESASDTASTESAMLEFAEGRDFDRIVLIQATSPLLTAADLSAGIAELERSGADSLLSVVEQKRFIWTRSADGVATPQNYAPEARPRRQDFEPYFVENGAFYICRQGALARTRCRLSGRIALYPMAEESYYELDEPSDWAIIEGLLLKRERKEVGTSCDGFENRAFRISQKEFAERAMRIKLFLTDVDGVLTDAGMYYSENGDELKKFNTRDGKGLELLRNAGIKIGIITTENTKIVSRRASKLKVDYLVQGAENKIPEFQSIIEKAGCRADEVAYIGDDLADLPVLKIVGLSACPNDAMKINQDTAHITTAARGGHGCVREFSDLILTFRNNEEAL